MRKRCRLRKKLDSSNCDDQNCGYEQKIRDIEKCICESHRDEQKQDELRAVNCIKNYANYFFRYAKKCSKRKDHIGPLRNENDELRILTVPRKWFFSYGTSSCITYFKLKEHLILIK